MVTRSTKYQARPCTYIHIHPTDRGNQQDNLQNHEEDEKSQSTARWHELSIYLSSRRTPIVHQGPTLRLRLMKPQSDRSPRTTCQSKPARYRTLQLTRRSLNLVKLLQQPNNNIARFRKSELLSNADTWPTVEREELPPDLPASKPFRSELVGVLAPEILAAMHDVNGVVDGAVGGEEDGRGTIWSTAARKGGGFVGALSFRSVKFSDAGLMGRLTRPLLGTTVQRRRVSLIQYCRYWQLLRVAKVMSRGLSWVPNVLTTSRLSLSNISGLRSIWWKNHESKEA